MNLDFNTAGVEQQTKDFGLVEFGNKQAGGVLGRQVIAGDDSQTTTQRKNDKKHRWPASHSCPNVYTLIGAL